MAGTEWEKTMKILEIGERPPALIQQLVELWESSVRATHHFLTDGEIEAIKTYVPQALEQVPKLVVAEGENGSPTAFMGIDGRTLEMLFVAEEERGKGLGKKLIEYGISACSVRKLAVDEQNPLAKGFYEHMGFRAYKRTERDGQGNPYPLLYMKLDGRAAKI